MSEVPNQPQIKKGQEKFITIVSGLPRSGTSLMMQMLKAGGMSIVTDEIRKPDIDNPRGYYELENVKKIQEDTSWLDDCYGKAFKMVSMLLYHLPENKRYKVIFMRRAMKEILASQKVMLERMGKEESLPSEKMAENYEKHLCHVEEWLSKQGNIDVLYVSYNDIIKDSKENAKKICEFLGEGLNPDLMAHAIVQSLHRQNFSENVKAESGASLPSRTKPVEQDVILITVDCLRADLIYRMKEHQVHAPNLEKILKNSLYFPHAVTNGPGTRFAFPALFMSKLPGELEGLGLPREGGMTLAEFFKKQGFATIGIHSNGWLSSEFHYNRGFDYFFDPNNWGKKEHRRKEKVKHFLKNHKWLYQLAKKGKNLLSRANSDFAFSYQFAEEVNKKLFGVISENKLEKQKKFIWLHYMDCHHPYFVRPELICLYPELENISPQKALSLWEKAEEDIKLLSGEEKTTLKSIYKSEISYIDHYIGEIHQRFPNALLVITADHGEEFGEHGRFHNPTFYNEMLEVPLIISGVNQNGENLSLISHIDIAPLMARYSGSEPDSLWSGSGNLNMIQYQCSGYSDYTRQGVALLDKEHKFILENGEHRLLERETDYPAENQEKINVLRKELDKLTHSISKKKIKIEDVRISKEVEQQLQDLGYL